LKDDNSFVFAQGWSHPENAIYCKIIYYPDPQGWIDIHGRPYGTTIKRRTADGLELIPHGEQLRKHYEVDPSLDPNEKRPCWAEYHVRIPLDRFTGYFEHRKSLTKAMAMYPQVDEAVRKASEALEVPVERLGCTGSLSYGRLEDPVDDVDLCIYGTLKQNAEVIKKILALSKKPRHRVVEFGKFWPMRFYYGELMICPFFEYSDINEVPLRELDTKILAEGVRARGRVKDDTHGIYMPVFLTLEDVTINGKKANDTALIIYDGSLRGEYYRGDLLEMTGVRLVEVRERGRVFEALLVTISNQITKSGGAGA
jgi:predicted nucleotidyltransferase